MQSRSLCTAVECFSSSSAFFQLLFVFVYVCMRIFSHFFRPRVCVPMEAHIHTVPCNILKNLATVLFLTHNQIHFLHNFQLLVHFSLWTKLTWLLVVDWMYSTDIHGLLFPPFSFSLPLSFFSLILCIPVINFPLNDAWLQQISSAHVLGITIMLFLLTHTLTTRMYRMQCVNKGMCQRLGTRLGIYVSWATYENKSKRANG